MRRASRAPWLPSRNWRPKRPSLRVLVACEFSGTVRDAFLARGHDAISCDLLPTESPGPHIQGDVTPLLREPWDLVIAHPPCRFLTVASGGALRHNPTRMQKLEDGARFFLDCLNANAPRVAAENPALLLRPAKAIIGRGADSIIQPFYFGDPWVKRTGLWLRGLEALTPTEIVEPIGYWVTSGTRYRNRRPIAPQRGRTGDPKKRALFFPGIARAMAEQWG